VRLPTRAHGEPRYDILTLGLALLQSVTKLCRLQVFGSLGHLGAFPWSFFLQPLSKFSSFHLEYPATHTHTQTNTHSAHIFLSFLSHNIPLPPPRTRRLDLPPHVATPNAFICTGAHAAEAQVELLRSLRLSVSSSSAGAAAQAFSGLPAGHGHVRHRRRAKGRISLDNQPGSSSQALHHALRSFELEHTCFEDSPETTLVLPRICSKLHLCEGGCLSAPSCCSVPRPTSLRWRILPLWPWLPSCSRSNGAAPGSHIASRISHGAHPLGPHTSAVGQGFQQCTPKLSTCQISCVLHVYRRPLSYLSVGVDVFALA